MHDNAQPAPSAGWAFLLVSPHHPREGGVYIPMQLVVPRAVRMAVAIEAISCAMNFAVSFFVIAFLI